MSVSKDVVVRWLGGWRALDEHRREEMRSSTIETRMTRLEALVASRELFPRGGNEWDESVAKRWARIRRAAGIR